MSDYQDDEALARLRAADPATGAHPDLHKMSARLRGRTPLGSTQSGALDNGDYGTAAYGSSDSSTAVHVPDPGARTGRSSLLVAAAVAAVALGGGGYAVGAATAGGDGGSRTGVASATEDKDDAEGGSSGISSGEARAAQDSAGDEDISLEEGQGGDAMASEADGAGYAGPAIPVAGEGLSTERTTGPVFVPDGGQSQDAPEQLRQYADALAIEGEVMDEGPTSSSVVDSTDGRTLNVYNYSGLTVDYSNPALDSYCEEMMASMSEEDGGGWFGPAGPAEIECVPLEGPPDEETAIATVQEFLDRAGIDYTGLEFTVGSYAEGVAYEQDMAATTAAPRQDSAGTTSAPEESSELVDPEQLQEHQDMMGQEMQDVPITVTDPASPVSSFRPWHFSVTSGGVAYAYLQLGDYVELGDYEVISPAEAVERANDSRFQQIGSYIPNLDYTYPSDGDEWAEPTPLPAVAPGESIPFPMTEAPVTSAELHTGVISLWDGTEYLVPVYALSDGNGNYWEVLGLAEEALDFTP